MIELYSDEYLRVERDDARRIVFVTRSAHRGDPDALVRAMHKALAALMAAEARGYGLIIDTRLAVGRNESGFESQVTEVRRELQAHFPRVVVLVSTAIGVLQTQRMAEADSDAPLVTTEFGKAVRVAGGG